MNEQKTIGKTAKKLLFKLGCTGAVNAVLNEKFENPQPTLEKTTGPLCGGIMQEGHQCGMLWGASLAVSTEASRRTADESRATVLAIESSATLVDSFKQRTKSADCREITRCNQTSLLGQIKYIITGKPLGCARLIKRWTPEAVEAAAKSLSLETQEKPGEVISCASVLAERMGASKEESRMVAGFAGGIGLSGGACGALGAAILLKSLDWQRKNPGDTTFKIPEGQKVLKAFLKETNSEVLCHKLCRKKFGSVEEHSEFVKNGGCENIIRALAEA